jgi:transcriptional regulator with XRE-family HTH domain
MSQGDPDQTERSLPISTPAELGRAVKVLRTVRDLSRRELAEAAGLSYSYLAEIENGGKQPSSRALAAIADGLGISAAELLVEAEELAAGRDRGRARDQRGRAARRGGGARRCGRGLLERPDRGVEEATRASARSAGPAAALVRVPHLRSEGDARAAGLRLAAGGGGGTGGSAGAGAADEGAARADALAEPGGPGASDGSGAEVGGLGGARSRSGSQGVVWMTEAHERQTRRCPCGS